MATASSSKLCQAKAITSYYVQTFFEGGGVDTGDIRRSHDQVSMRGEANWDIPHLHGAEVCTVAA